jgi:hypothetical protein
MIMSRTYTYIYINAKKTKQNKNIEKNQRSAL